MFIIRNLTNRNGKNQNPAQIAGLSNKVPDKLKCKVADDSLVAVDRKNEYSSRKNCSLSITVEIDGEEKSMHTNTIWARHK